MFTSLPFPILPDIKLFFFKKKTSHPSLELGQPVTLPHFLQVIWTKIFLLSFSISCQNFVVCLPLLRDILGSKFIVIVFLTRL